MPSVAERLASRWETTVVSVPNVERQPAAPGTSAAQN